MIFAHVAVIAVLIEAVEGVSIFEASLHNPALSLSVVAGIMLGAGLFLWRRFAGTAAFDYPLNTLSARRVAAGLAIAFGPVLIGAGKRLFDF